MHPFIAGTGGFLPEKVITNQDLAARIDTSDAWIRTRTGIGQRHVVSEGESTSTLATNAALKALEDAQTSVEAVDMVIVATATPDYAFPAVATQVQAAIGAHQAVAFDIQAACSGFIYGLSMADAYMQKGTVKTILLVGAETFSRILDWEDRTTSVLFGDGAGAVVLKATDNPDVGLMGSDIYSDGRYVDALRSYGGVATEWTFGIDMNGREVFKHASRAMADMVEDSLQKFKFNKADIDWLVPHQANKRIIEATAKIIGLPEEKVILTIEDHANTSAASIPLAMNVAAKAQKFKQGDLLFLEAFGAGFTWASAVVRWGTSA